jgi:hypothetical protein
MVGLRSLGIAPTGIDCRHNLANLLALRMARNSKMLSKVIGGPPFAQSLILGREKIRWMEIS